jgi:hypothetical protein
MDPGRSATTNVDDIPSMSTELKAILDKFNTWHQLRLERGRLEKELQRKRISEEIEDLMSSRNIAALLGLLRQSRDIGVNLEKFLLAEFENSIRFDSRSRISATIECIGLLGIESPGCRELLTGHLARLLAKEKKSSYERIRMLEGFREYDQVDGLGTSEFIKEGIRAESEEFAGKLVDSPLQLDRWLNEAVQIYRYYPGIAERYRAAELRYFSVCLELIENEQPDDAREDLASLLSKIKRRSGAVDAGLYEDVLARADESGLVGSRDTEAQ